MAEGDWQAQWRQQLFEALHPPHSLPPLLLGCKTHNPPPPNLYGLQMEN